MSKGLTNLHTTIEQVASNGNFTAQNAFRAEEIQILQSVRATQDAVVVMANAIYKLTNNRMIQDIVLNRFKGKIHFFNNKVGLKCEIFFDGNDWKFRAVGYEDREEVGDERIVVGSTRGFSLDEMACFISAFDQAYKNRDARFSTFRVARPGTI